MKGKEEQGHPKSHLSLRSLDAAGFRWFWLATCVDVGGKGGAVSKEGSQYKQQWEAREGGERGGANDDGREGGERHRGRRGEEEEAGRRKRGGKRSAPLDVANDNTHRVRVVLVPHLDELGKLVRRIRDVEFPWSSRTASYSREKG